jgi:hypothetical protein
LAAAICGELPTCVGIGGIHSSQCGASATLDGHACWR